MPTDLRYVAAAKAFLTMHPLGTTVRGEAIIAWARDHAAALAHDLLVCDRRRQIGSLCRHLNMGGSARSCPKADRFRIEVADKTRDLYLVRPLAEVIPAAGALPETTFQEDAEQLTLPL
jgi:hypothetical protein